MSGFEIQDYTEPVKANPYTPLVAQLSEAGEGKLGRFRVPKGEKANTHKAKFSKAARDQGFTAHLKVDEHDEKTGEVILGFVLGPIRQRRTKEQIAAESATMGAEATADADKG